MIPLGVLASRRPASGGATLEFRAMADASATDTLPSVPLGAPGVDRQVIVLIGRAGTTARTIDSVTVGGVSATADVAPATTASIASIWRATVPTGTTADVTVTWSGGTVAWAAWVFSSATDLAVIDSAEGQAAGTRPDRVVTHALDTAAGDAILAVSGCASGQVTLTWTGATPAPASANPNLTAAATAEATGSSTTVTVHGDNNSSANHRMAAIAYRPA